jgi:hypothetical protein
MESMIYRKFIMSAVLMSGWYLMLPPAGQQNGVPWPDHTAPISHWTIAESFDTAKACETELKHNRAHFAHNLRKTSQADAAPAFWARFYVEAAGGATCIASDDIRLKETAGQPSPDLQPSTAVQHGD